MATRPKLSETEALEQYRIALENAENQSEIATVMSELGYDSTKIAEGKTLLAATRKAYDANKTEDDETSEASANFKKLKEQLANNYASDRRKAKIIFRKDNLTSEKLGLTGSIPQAYIKWLELTRKFYTTTLKDTEIQNKLTRLGITPGSLTSNLTLISQLETARTDYLREVGESQDSTKIKDAAFVKMDDWMSEFYAVAKIALEDNPQLLESLGKLVRS
jgi:predicted RNase H-like nuclease (RuvC/YqgF family)